VVGSHRRRTNYRRTARQICSNLIAGRDRAESAKPETKIEYSNSIAALQFKRDEVSVKLQGISSASDDEWEELKTGTEHVLGEVRTIFHNVITMII
jgi:hypothetical protein